MPGDKRRTVGAVLGTLGSMFALAGLVMALYGGAVIWRATASAYVDVGRNEVIEMGAAIAGIGGAVFVLGALLAAIGAGAYVSGRATNQRGVETSF